VRLSGGAGLSAREGKRKREAGAWAAAGRRWWAAGPPGQKGGEGRFLFFLFFFKLFSNQSLNSNSNQIPFKSFTKFYTLFKSHSSNQKPCKTK
jgi:hypothetical protein